MAQKVIQNIPPVGDFESQGKRMASTIYLVKDEDVDYSKLPVIPESPSRSMPALTLQSSAKWAKFDFCKYTGASESEGSSGDVTSSATNKVLGTIGGERAEIDDFIEGNLGKGFFVVTIDRISRKKTIYGRPYSPMIFSHYVRRKNQDNTSCDVEFTNESLLLPLDYEGECEGSLP